MPFKWERFWSEPRGSRFRAPLALAHPHGIAFSLALLLALSASPFARATVTAQEQIGGNFISAGGPGANTFYVAGQAQPGTARGTSPTLSGCAPAGGGVTGASGSNFPGQTCVTYFDSGFHSFDLGASAITDSANNPNMLQFQLTSTNVTGTSTTSTTSSGYVVAVRVNTQSGGTNLLFVPIAAIGGVPCPGPGCISIGANVNYTNGTPAYYAAPFTPGSTITVGIYPADICWAAANLNPTGGQTAATPAACTANNNASNGVTVTPVISGNTATGTPTPLQLEFDIFPAPTTVGAALSGSPTDSGPYQLAFQGDTPLMVPSDNCPGVTTSYTPGDGQIFVNTAVFSLDIANATGSLQAPMDSNHAPAYAIVVASVQGADGTAVPDVGNSGSNPSGAAATAAADTALQVLPPDIPYPGTQALGGFKNVNSSSNTDPNTYQLQFMVRDANGMVAVPVGDGCTLKDVQTSQIQGFLSQSQCFIATGAFRSPTAAPVMLLRAFRDRVLEHVSAGRAFVRWYYGWSPPAALWLFDHPLFRFPVLIALVPLEALAWLALHPIMLGLTLAIGLAMLSAALARWERGPRPRGERR